MPGDEFMAALNNRHFVRTLTPHAASLTLFETGLMRPWHGWLSMAQPDVQPQRPHPPAPDVVVAFRADQAKGADLPRRARGPGSVPSSAAGSGGVSVGEAVETSATDALDPILLGFVALIDVSLMIVANVGLTWLGYTCVALGTFLVATCPYYVAQLEKVWETLRDTSPVGAGDCTPSGSWPQRTSVSGRLLGRCHPQGGLAVGASPPEITRGISSHVALSRCLRHVARRPRRRR